MLLTKFSSKKSHALWSWFVLLLVFSRLDNHWYVHTLCLPISLNLQCQLSKYVLPQAPVKQFIYQGFNYVVLNISFPQRPWNNHYHDVVMSAMASQITNLTIVYSDIYSGAVKKHQSSASLAFVRGIHRWPVNSPHKGPVTRKMFPFDDVIMSSRYMGKIDRHLATTGQLKYGQYVLAFGLLCCLSMPLVYEGTLWNISAFLIIDIV